jgi:hypothetical protein
MIIKIEKSLGYASEIKQLTDLIYISTDHATTISRLAPLLMMA